MLGQGLASAAHFKAAHKILIKQSDASSCTAFPQNSLFWVQAESCSSRFLQLRSRWLQQYLCLEGSVFGESSCEGEQGESPKLGLSALLLLIAAALLGGLQEKQRGCGIVCGCWWLYMGRGSAVQTGSRERHRDIGMTGRRTQLGHSGAVVGWWGCERPRVTLLLTGLVWAVGSLIFPAINNNLKTRPHYSIFIQSATQLNYTFTEINTDRSRSGWGGQVDIETGEE